MKIMVKEVEGQGFEALLGKRVFLFCANYHYVGTLTGVNEQDIILTNPAIVYETGAWSAAKFSNVEDLPTPEIRIRTAAVEAYFESKK